jgi:hypothetical protein
VIKATEQLSEIVELSGRLNAALSLLGTPINCDIM